MWTAFGSSFSENRVEKDREAERSLESPNLFSTLTAQIDMI